MREAAYYATLRASESELQRILSIGGDIEQLILEDKDRTLEEQAFHRAIAKATHNDLMNRLMPVLQEAIDKGVTLSKTKKTASEDTIVDHKILMDFMENRNAEGAKNAMRIHILHAIERLGSKKLNRICGSMIQIKKGVADHGHTFFVILGNAILYLCSMH